MAGVIAGGKATYAQTARPSSSPSRLVPRRSPSMTVEIGSGRTHRVSDGFDHWAVELPALPEQWHIEKCIGDADERTVGNRPCCQLFRVHAPSQAGPYS